MRSRHLAGWKGLVLAVAVASLVLLPFTGAFAEKRPTSIMGSEDDSFGPRKTQREDDEIKRPTLFTRSNYVWPFATGPTYGLANVERGDWRMPGMLHTAVGHFDLTRGLPDFPAELQAVIKVGELGAQYFVLQLHPSALGDGSYDQIRDLIEADGGAFMEPLPVAGFIVRMNPASHGVIQGQAGVIALMPYHPALKISPIIGRVALPDAARAISDVYKLEVTLFPGEDPATVAQAIAALGGNVTATWPDTVKVELHRQLLPALAALEPVKMIHEDMPVVPSAEETSHMMQTGDTTGVGSVIGPYHDAGNDGGGGGIAAIAQALMIVDSGIQIDAGELSNTKTLAGTFGLGHRKVRNYQTTNAFGGSGDLFGCDDTLSGGFTHGHTVASTALGWATEVDPSYIDDASGAGYIALDDDSNPWSLDGVAPEALLYAYDANVTPANLSCSDPSAAGLSPGNLYTAGHAGGSMDHAYHLHVTQPVHTYSFSFGSPGVNTYTGGSSDIDAFMFEHADALVFASAGNDSIDSDSDGIPDALTVTAPATCKNCISVGASGGNSSNGANRRAGFSSVGPATLVSNRIAPVLMAPGTDFGFFVLGMDSEYNCRSNDNDQTGAVECDLVFGLNGTSFAAPAAAGAAMVVRDFLGQGFYPDATVSNTGNVGDLEPSVSGSMVKAILVASAEFMTSIVNPGGSLTEGFRGNFEQGFGRIELDNVLPLATWSPSPTGLILADGGIAGGPNNTNLSGSATSTPVPTTETFSFTVDDITQPLRIAIAWTESATDAVANNIDLELQAPDGTIYFGNFFSEDVDRNDTLGGTENCIDGFDGLGTPGEIDEGGFSIPTNTCGAAIAHDSQNNVESIVLHPDPEGNSNTCFNAAPPNNCPRGGDDPLTGAVDESLDNQLQVGNWDLRVIGQSIAGTQAYSVALAGPVALGSSVRFRLGSFVCNDLTDITINETDPSAATGDNDTDLDAAAAGAAKSAEVASRLSIEVINANNVVLDVETGLTVVQPNLAALRFTVSNLLLSDGTARSGASTFNNGVLDIRSGERLRINYADEVAGVADSNKARFNTAIVDCDVSAGFGGVIWTQFGLNSSVLIDGGCERDARGKFTFGFPDKFMDAEELIGYRIAFQSTEPTVDLTDVEFSLRCVDTDVDSPEDCKPGTSQCTDPNRTNNPTCSHLTVLDSPKTIGLLPNGNAVSANFTIQMAASITGTPEIEMVGSISAPKSGKSGAGIIVQRHTLNVDEKSLFYSTDFPTGGTQQIDWGPNTGSSKSGDEIINASNGCISGTPCTEAERGTPVSDIGIFSKDYRFETWVWSDLTASGTKNTGLQSPWNFDANDGGFRVGLQTSTDNSLANPPSNWGEDFNFNGGVPDAGEDRDPINGAIDNNWSQSGGCGWQTRTGTGTCGAANPCGAWHTGRVDATTLAICNAPGAISSQCQQYETSGFGTAEERFWMEMLKTPVIEKVNPTFEVEFLSWQWNISMDLADDRAFLTWELDTDTTVAEFNLDSFPVLNLLAGNAGAVSGGNSPLTDGFMLFATTHTCSGATSVICSGDQDCIDLGLGTCQQNGVGLSTNGSVGTNRTSKNSCFFEQGSNILPFNLAGPWDNDQNEDADGSTDEFVTNAGPLRNFNLSHSNGSDMRFSTLEDIYGASGNSFQAGLGFLTIEGTATPPISGFGAAVDDMVITWREVELAEDVTSCTAAVDATGGGCASIEIQHTNVFEGTTVLGITVIDRSPYNLNDGPTNNDVNDCNLNGSFADVGIDDTDCNNNGTEDIVVLLTSESLDQEIVALDLTGNAGVYSGNISISTIANVDGVLFLRSTGTDNPTVTVRYEDNDEGTGVLCPNDSAFGPTTPGVVVATTTVFITRGTVIASGFRITDFADAGCPAGSCGDGDPYPDEGETLNLFLSIANKTTIDLSDLTIGLSTNDIKIDCILNPFVPLVSLLDAATTEIGPFIFKVADGIDRGTINDDFSAEFIISVTAAEFDALFRAQEISLDLNLNVSGGATPTTFAEGWDVGVGGSSMASFSENDIDAGKNTLVLSDGFRCSYNDPDNPNSNSFANPDCFLGFANKNDNGFDWHVHKSQAPDGGRSFTGANSLHYGKHGGSPTQDTTRFKQLEAATSNALVHLGHVAVTPQLRMRQQVSFMDSRGSNVQGGQSVDRGVVQIRINGDANWQKISPFENIHDVQGTDQFSNCLFDPTDDGNTEDDFFDPTDPNARLGPSSTCFPEFVFGFQGDTNWNNPFSALATGRASDPTNAAAGAIGNGTWMTTTFDLSRFKGRSLDMRFLTTTIEIAANVDYIAAGFDVDIVEDDGWFIDQLEVTDALSTPATASVDNDPFAGVACGANCTTVTPNLVATPAALDAPGQVTSLDASGSTANQCADGVLQFQFWIDGNANGTLGEVSDTLLRDWTDNPLFIEAPGVTTQLGVKVRCSSATAIAGCDGEDAVQNIVVTCPGSAVTPSLNFAANKTTLIVDGNPADVISGDLDLLRTTGTYTGTVNPCLFDNSTGPYTDATAPAVGASRYYLSSLSENNCNGTITYGVGTRDAQIAADGNACP